ncbi:MAG: class I SAM-dependent methyltransferase [Acetobacteraceae bacterium]
MFTVSECRFPSKKSLSLVERFAPSLVERYSGNPVVWKLEEYILGHKFRLAFDTDYAIRYLPADCSVLEVGAFPYFLTFPLLTQGFKVCALDQEARARPAAEDVAEGRLNPSSLRCDLDRDPIPAEDNSFDAIIINEVIEHLRINLIHSINELRRVLKPGGVLLMSTPNFRSVGGICNFIFKGEAWSCVGGVYEQFSLLETHGTMGHIREYTPTELKTFLERIGFKVDGIIHRGRYRRRQISHYISILRPQLKPFFSLVCSKPQ